MTTLQRNDARGESRASSSDQLRRTATIVGWLFVITYIT